ncbi:DUF1273 domain-containing protein [Pseudalkalibacillus berkeleyi]|uniref:DUF1273 domain-containing protein n=1 Tax=Pseudalkalibacillus berkeleyi TaxID=1069813 RepID=UPI0022A87819|nr:DUF1273 domain-containing protein [Pseudalkalibacillus berkeleyi]
MIKVVAITGYKAHELGIFTPKHEAIPYIKGVMKKRIIQLVDEGLEWVVITGQQGVELWTGEVVLELKEDYPELNLAVLTPFEDQEQKWKEPSQEYYHQILSQADFVDSVSKRPYENPGQLQACNQFIIQKTDALIVLYDTDQPGYPEYYLKTAHKYQEDGNEYPILSISFFDINDYIDEQKSNMNDWAT